MPGYLQGLLITNGSTKVRNRVRKKGKRNGEINTNKKNNLCGMVIEIFLSYII